MRLYVIRRLLQAIPILLLISILLFGLVNLAPGGPLAGYSQGRHMNPEKAEILRRQLGLDKPLMVQYLIWLVGNDWMGVDSNGDGAPDSAGIRKGVVRGDFGFSFQTRRPVLDEIWAYLRNTLYLMSVTLFVTILIAVPVGIYSALRQYSKFDIVVTTLTFIGQAIPEFWLGLLLILVFYGMLNNPFTGEPLLPAGGMYTLGAPFSVLDWVKHLILPVTMGMVGWVAWYSRILRSSMLDVIHQDYIRAAHARGVSSRTIYFRHALKNAAIPLVTIFALDLPFIFAGSVYVELLFAWPGMGRLFYQAAVRRDYPLLMAILMIGSVFVILANLFADVFYAYLDPRVRLE
jgi:peptide/nickel transport system permease protein